MRVLLADPPHHHLRGASVQVHPLALGALAAALAPRHEVWQLVPDVVAADPADPWRRIRETLIELRPEVLGVTALTATFPAALALAELARGLLPGLRVVLGGPHPSARPAEALASPAVDAVVTGEGEDTLLELLERWSAGQDPAGLPGLWARGADGTPVRGPPRAARADLDSLPPPRRHGVLWAEHLRSGFYQSLITVRGCPYTCTYCAVPGSDGRKTRYRSAGHVADEIAALRADWDVPYLHFHDSVFTLHRRRSLELAGLMVERDLALPFTCQTRADRVDPALLDALAASGCRQIFFGIESGHPETLARIHKAMPLQQIRDAVGWARARGIRAAGFFMIGFPWEGSEHIDATVDFATGLELDALSLFSAVPLPGTALWDEHPLPVLPERMDFRAPELNLTALADYPARFLAARARFDAYNQARMAAQVASHWPRG